MADLGGSLNEKKEIQAESPAQDEDSDALDEDGLLKKLVEDRKMFVTLCCAACYCLTFTVVCGYFTFNEEAFTDGILLDKTSFVNDSQDCFAMAGQEQSVSALKSDATDVSLRFFYLIEYGFYIHLLGFFADSSMAIRIYAENKIFRLAAVILVSFYTAFWFVWLIWAHVIRFRFIGRVCSGSFLEDKEAQPGYAVEQGKVILGVIIGIWGFNFAIVIVSVILGIVGKRYLASKGISDAK